MYGSYPDIDGLFREQPDELDRKKRQVPPEDPPARARQGDGQVAFINGRGSRVAEFIPEHTCSAPYEDVKLKAGT